jgi:hypothetical protein
MDTQVAGYEVSSDDGRFKQVRPTIASAESLISSAQEGRQNTVEKLTGELEKTQATIDSNREKLNELDQIGEQDSAGYKKIESNTKNLVSKVSRLNEKIQSVSQPLQIKAKQEKKSRKGFTLFEGGKPVGTYPTQEDAEIAAVAFRTDEELDGIINAAPKAQLEGALEQPFGEQPVQVGTVRGGMPRRLYDEAVKEKDRRYRSQAGLPPPAAPVKIKITGDAQAAAERLRASGITVRFMPEVEKEIPEINKRLRVLLDRLGLKDVRLNIIESIKVPGFVIYDQRNEPVGFIKKVDPNSPEFAKNMATIAQARANGMRVEEGIASGNGSYAARLIEIALNSEDDAIRATRHEAIHALKELGFFTPQQWAVLERRAKSEWMAKYEIEKRYSDLTLEGQIEEAIAEAFSDFDQTKAPVGQINILFNKIKTFFEALGNAFRGSGFQTASDVFTLVEEGRLTDPGAAVTGETKFSLAKVLSQVSNDIGLTDAELAATSLGLQTGKGGTKAFKEQKVGGIKNIIEFLENRYRESGLPPLNINSEQDRETLSKLLSAEALAAIRSGGANIEWYNQVIDKMLGMASLKYPELRSDPNAQAAFRIAIAVSSQGMNVEDNLKFGERVYEQFHINYEEGVPRFPEIGTGESLAAMKNNFRIANLMIEKMGMDDFRRFLETPFTANELNAVGLKVDELADEQVLGSSIFGPKIGFGFYSNLTGNFDPVTMDMWFMRTIGRLIGKLRGFDPAKYQSQIDRFRSRFGINGDNGIYANQFSREELENAIADEQAMIGLARKVKSLHEKDFKNNRSLFDSGQRVKTDFVKSAENIIKSLDAPKDAPANGTERRLLRDVVRRMREKVANVTGQDIPPASLQAIIWYPEQELYKALGAKLRVTSQNYADSMRKLLREEGFDERRISAAAQSGSRRARRADARDVAAGLGEADRRAGRALSPEAREDFLETERERIFFEGEIEQPRARTLIFEVAPNPDDAQAMARWNQLSPEQKTKISKDVIDNVLPKAMEAVGIQGYLANQIGSYENDTNPSFGLFVKKGSADQILELAKMLGYALSQKSMVVASPKETKGLDKNGAIRILVGNIDIQKADQIYQRLRAIRVNGKPILDGQTTVHGQMVIMNFYGLTIEEFAEKIHNQLNGEYNVTIDDVYSSLIEEKDYKYGDPKSDPRGNRGVLRERSRALRTEASNLLDQKIKEAGKFSLRLDELVGGPSIGSGISIRPQQPTAQSFDAVHYGKQRVETLFGSMYGTGIKGAEAQRVFNSDDPRVRQRAYFYIPFNNGRMPKPEAGLGQEVHVQRLNNLLGPGPEMQGLASASRTPDGQFDENAFESSVIDAGYDGYAVPNMGMAVVLGSDVPVVSRGTRQEVEAKPDKDKIQIGDRKYSLRQTNTKEFKDWFGDSKIVNGDSTPKVMYHGLAKDTTDFTRKTERGAPIFLTDDPTFAPRFAADSYASVARNPEPYLTKEQIDGGVKRAIAAIKKDYGKDSLGKEMIESLKTGNLKDATPEAREYIQKEFINLLPTGPHIMPLYVRAERSFDYDNPEHIERVINNLKDSNINTELLSYDLNKGDWETIESPRVQEAIKELGFDSFYVEEIGRKNLAVYEPNQVKSAIGNLGTFSRTNNDIRYSLALEGLKPSSALIPDEGGNPSGNLGFMPEKLGGKPIRLLVGTHNDLVDELVNEKMYRPVSYGGNHILNRIMSYPRREPIGTEELLEKIARAAQKTSQTYTRIYKDGKRFILFDGKNSLILGENPDSMSIITMYTQTDPNRRYGNPAWFGRAPVVPEFVGAIRGTKVEAKEGRIAPSEVDTKAKRVYTPSEVGAIAAGESTKEPTKGTLSLNKKMSLRVPDKTVTKFFDDQEQIPMSEGVEIIRDNWIGGVSGIGDRDGVYYLDQVYGGPEYTQQVQDLVRKDLGESFKGYRLMSQEEFEELQTGAIGTQLASVSLVPETALAIASIPQYSRRPKGDLIVVELDLTPDHVQMVGHVPEKELIIDYGIGYDPTAIEPIISPVRFSLKDFDRNDLPKGDARKRSVYTLPAGTKLYHGSNKDTAAEIKKAGHVLLAEPPYKSSGGDTSEGYLIWFGDKEIADRYAEGQAEGRAARDKKEPGEVFATVTNEPMRLVEQERYELNAEQAKKINDFYKMPDYKLFKAGENLGNVSTRLLNHSDARAKAKSYTNINGDPQYSILKDIASLLGFDGYYYDLGVALPSERGISLGLTEAGEFVGKPMTRFSLRQQIIDGADAIARMPKDVKENTEYGDMPGGYQSHNFYEARKLAPKPTNKLKKVTENNSETLNMETDYVLNVDGEHYYIVLEEDPDDEDAFVYSFSPATDPNKFTTTVTFDVDELIKEIRDSAPTAPRTQYSLAGAANLQSFGLAPTDAKDNAIFLLQDKNIDLKRIIEGIRKNGKILSEDYDAYRKEELFHGRSATLIKFFLDRELRPLLQKMQNANISLEQMDDYLLARHAKEANAYIRKVNPDKSQNSGMTDKEADDFMKALPTSRRNALDSISRDIDAITKKTREIMVDTGLESQNTVNQWEKTYKNYVPLFREEIEDGRPISLGRGFDIRGSTTRQRMGSSRKVVDVLANIAMQRERTIVRGEKNRIGKSLYGLILDNPHKGFWGVINPEKMSKQAMRTELSNLGLDPNAVDDLVDRPPKKVINKSTGLVSYEVPQAWKSAPNIFATRINGEDRFMIFNKQDERAMRMVATLKSLDAQQQGEAIKMMGTAGDYYRKSIGGIGTITRYFAQINTQYNPAFGIYNLMRDIGGAVLNLQTTPLKGQEAKVVSDALIALKAVYQDLRRQRQGLGANSKWASIFEEFESEGGKTGYRDLFETSESRAESLQQELKDFGQGKIRGSGKAVMGWLSDFNDAIENSVRVSVYHNAKQEGLSNAAAASLAKNITVNFNRSGAVSRNFQTLFAFFNASIQGTARIAQTLLTSEGKLSPTGKKIVMGGITLGIIQAALLAMAGLDEDEVPDFVKDKSFVIPYGDGKYFAVPMPLGYNVIPSFGRRVMEFAMSEEKNVGKAVFDTSSMIIDGFNPLGSATFVQTLTPTILDPIVALAENKDFTGKPIFRDDINSLSPTPGYTRGSQNSFAITEALAYGINILTGGSEFKKGALSPTPDQIEYLVGEAFGGVGREALKVGRGIESLATGEELATYNVPIVGRLTGNVQQQAAQRSKFFNNIRRLNEHQAEIEGRLLQGDDINDYIDQYPESSLYQAGDKIYNQITKLRRTKKVLEESGAGKDDLKSIDETILSLMSSLNEIYDSARQQ